MRDKILEDKVTKLANKFKELRLEQSIFQAKLAAKIGMSNRAIGLIESGERTPTILTCLKICKALGVSLDDLLKKI